MRTAIGNVLGAGLIDVAAARRAVAGQQGKLEVLYNCLSSTQFKQRIEGIVEAFVTMRDDLEAEKRAMEKIWAKRDKQLERAVIQTSGMYGDLNGIIGSSLPAIEHLSLPAVSDDDFWPVSDQVPQG